MKEIRKTRMVANVQADYSFSDEHSLFGRVSTHIENADFNSGGSYRANNYIIDFEVQDNISLAWNYISFGGNIRSVKYYLSDFGANNQSLFAQNNNDAMLIGLFAQDKMSFFNDKFNLYLGVKTENFSLINDKYYFSPMAKFMVTPISAITLWGGYTQSYTTPGYN